jgi:hypothetical protein
VKHGKEYFTKNAGCSTQQQWHTLAQFVECVEHVLMQWTESRHNPHFSRFDAINNKYDNIAVPPELGQ